MTDILVRLNIEPGFDKFNNGRQLRTDAANSIRHLRQRIAELEDPHYVKGLRAEIEWLEAKIAYVRQRSQPACEILNEYDATEPKP